MSTITVLGQEISAEVQEALLKRMKQAAFTSAELADEAVRLGIPRHLDQGRRFWADSSLAHRVADRLIQRQRKAKNIALQKRPVWVWVGA